MVSAVEARIRRFVSEQIRNCPELSTLTIGIIRRRYLACFGRDSPSLEERQLIKRVVEEELMRMQDSDNDTITCITPIPRKRKRDETEVKMDKGSSLNADASDAKKTRYTSAHADYGTNKLQNEERQKEKDEEKCEMTIDEEGEQKEQITQMGTKKKKKGHRIKSSCSEGEEQHSNEENCENKLKKQEETPKSVKRLVSSDSDSEKDITWKRRTAGGKKKNQEKVQSERTKQNQMRRRGTGDKGEGLQRGGSTGSDSIKTGQAKVFEQKRVKRQNNNGNGSDRGASLEDSNGEEEETEEVVVLTTVEKAQDSSSSLPSLEDEQESEKVRKKKKTVAKLTRKEEVSDTGSKGGKDDENVVVARLKRYIALCGVRRNYKKLLDGCPSTKSKVLVLKRELETLGVTGRPSIEKCNKARLRREEAQELADLDLSNIINTEGRPKRRVPSLWKPQSSPPLSAHKRVESTESEDSDFGRGRKRPTDWGNLLGIISDGEGSE